MIVERSLIDNKDDLDKKFIFNCNKCNSRKISISLITIKNSTTGADMYNYMAIHCNKCKNELMILDPLELKG